jgi:SAM-dependent methyltransferase
MWSNYDNSSVNLLKNQIEDDLDEKNKFNVIFAFEVLEHLLEPKLLLSKVRDLLLPKGRFVASTPNAASLEVNIMKNHSNTLDIEHISILTPSSIHSLASQNNFKVIKLLNENYPELLDISRFIIVNNYKWDESLSALIISNNDLDALEIYSKIYQRNCKKIINDKNKIAYFILIVGCIRKIKKSLSKKL